MLIYPVFRKRPLIIPTMRRTSISSFGAAANNAAPLIGAGGFYVGGLSTPQPWDSWDFDTSVDLSIIPDSTQAVQNAINAAAANNGGVVYLPPGVIRVNGVTINSGGISIVGTGWEGGSGGLRGKRGTYVLTDKNVYTLTVGAGANPVRVEGVTFLQTQPPDAGGWSPGIAHAAINVGGAVQGGSILIVNCQFWGCAGGIEITGSGPNAGNVTVRDCRFATYFNGVLMTNGVISATFDNLSVDSSSLPTNQAAYAQANANGLNLGPGQVVVTNYFANQLERGIFFGIISGPIRLSNLDIRTCSTGVGSQGAVSGSRVHIEGISFKGLGAASASYGLFLQVGEVADITDAYFSNVCSSPIVCWDSGVGAATEMRFGPSLWVDNWNLNPTADPLVTSVIPNPSPALTCHGGGPHIYYSSGALRLTNSNGGPATGGGGLFTAY